MNSKKVIGLIALIFVFLISCAGTTEQDLSFNPTEPWTGSWKLTRDPGWGILTWKLKQNGNLVKAAKGSDYKVELKVTGNRAEGWYFFSDYLGRHTVKMNMSEDLQSFEGQMSTVSPAYNIGTKGERQD